MAHIYNIYIYSIYTDEDRERERVWDFQPAMLVYYRILANPQQRCFAKDPPRTLPRLACIRSTRLLSSRCSISIIISHLWYPKIVNYHCLTLQMRLLDPLLIYLTTWDTLSPDCSLEKGSLFPTRSCFHKGSAHSPQGQRSIGQRVAF